MFNLPKCFARPSYDVAMTVARVHAGARLLDSRLPGWADRVTRRLDFCCHQRCPLGQTFGHYSVGLSTLCVDPVPYGFDGEPQEKRLLTRLWNREIQSRRIRTKSIDKVS